MKSRKAGIKIKRKVHNEYVLPVIVKAQVHMSTEPVAFATTSSLPIRQRPTSSASCIARTHAIFKVGFYAIPVWRVTCYAI